MAKELTLHLKNTEAEMEKMVLWMLASRLGQSIQSVTVAGMRALRPLIKDAILRCPEMGQLQGGKLAGELGLWPSLQTLAPEMIAEAVAETVFLKPVKVVVVGNQLKGGMLLQIQPSDFQNVLGLDIGTYKYFRRTKRQTETIPWLRWLLTAGSSPVLLRYHLEAGGPSRSGKGVIMKKPGTWSVPSDSAGTIEDNFITRALNEDKKMRNDLLSILNRLWVRQLSAI